MLSLRAFTRSLPRTASRIAIQTPKTSFRPAFQSTLRSPVLSRCTVAAFSTTRSRFDEYSQQLAAKLASEIELESEESAAQADSDTNVQQFRDENPDWNIEDKPGEQDIFLRRKFDDEEVIVHFNVADFNNPMMSEDEMDGAMGDEEDMLPSNGGPDGKAINQGRADNFKQMPEDSIAPADREEMQDDVRFRPPFTSRNACY